MIKIRRFEDRDLEATMGVVKEAFYREGKDADFNEWNFVDNIRSDKDYVKDLCLIAKSDDEYLGYNILTKGSVGDQKGLILGPIAVKPSHQKKRYR
jgi:putative acetyltransferase